jgi:hypothetical protein
VVFNSGAVLSVSLRSEEKMAELIVITDNLGNGFDDSISSLQVTYNYYCIFYVFVALSPRSWFLANKWLQGISDVIAINRSYLLLELIIYVTLICLLGVWGSSALKMFRGWGLT